MSAFIVNDNHISALVRWACRDNLRYYRRNADGVGVAGNEQRIAQLLLDENIKSVNHRYNETTEQAIVYDAFATNLLPIEVIKACHCLAYQSCEHDGWEASEAKCILDSIEAAAIRRLPGYDAAKWEIQPKQVEPA
jgi:hypothetical protein